MKKFIVAALACAMMISSVVANAAEFKASGSMDLTAESIDNAGYVESSDTNGVDIMQRFRSD